MIVKSILDTDLYKFTTSYAYMKLFPQARGTFEFFDRDLTEYPEDFVQKVYLELSNLGMLRLTNSELDYMTSNCRFVPQVYWEWLYSFRFNSGKVQVWLDDKKHLHITVTDYLYKVTLYEVPILAIISELRNRVLGNNCDMSEVIKKLEPKLRLSNVAGIKFSDTYTSEVFMKNLSRKQAKLFDGVRCDSGDEFKFINSMIARYKELGVDPTTKTIVFSNALDFDKCQDIMEYCGSRIRCSFGIGTNLTNDTGFKPANIVMKLISCQMNVNQPVYGCVKLSDDKGKHTGEMREVKSCLSELGL